MGQEQSAPACQNGQCCGNTETGPSGNILLPTQQQPEPGAPHTVRVHCVEVTTENMQKLEALLSATDCPQDYALRQRGLQTLSRTFTMPRDATVASIKAHIFSNGTVEAAAIGQQNLGKFDLFALQRPLPERMAAVQKEQQQADAATAVGSAMPCVSQSYDVASLVALPEGLPVCELLDCDQFLVDLNEDVLATTTSRRAATGDLSLTFFYREESVFGACCFGICCGPACRVCCCRACVCDACCKPTTDIRVRAGGVRVTVNGGGRKRRARNYPAPAHGTVLEYRNEDNMRSSDSGTENSDEDEARYDENPLAPRDYAKATKSGGAYY